VAHDQETASEAQTERELRGELIATENAELSRLYQAGTISAATRQRLQRSLDLEAARLAEGQR
jgi:CPA1 family monovalent cation:H+ antiporter